MSKIIRDFDKALYQPWRESDFQSDLYVRTMTSIQKWIYKSLLQAAFDYTTRPYLPNDDDLLWMLAGCESQKQWLENAKVIRARFTEVMIDGKPMLSHKRLVEDWNRWKSVSDKRAQAGRNGGKAKAKNDGIDGGKSQTIAKQMLSEAKQSEAIQPNPNQPPPTVEGRSAISIEIDSPAAGHTAADEGSGPSPLLPSPSANPPHVSPTGPKKGPVVEPIVGSASVEVSAVAGGVVEEKPTPTPTSKAATETAGAQLWRETKSDKVETMEITGIEKLPAWRKPFDTAVQTAAAEGGVVLRVPFPSHVYRFVDELAKQRGFDAAQAIVVNWIESRNFDGLMNPNVVWNKMLAEIGGFVEANK